MRDFVDFVNLCIPFDILHSTGFKLIHRAENLDNYKALVERYGLKTEDEVIAYCNQQTIPGYNVSVQGDDSRMEFPSGSTYARVIQEIAWFFEGYPDSFPVRFAIIGDKELHLETITKTAIDHSDDVDLSDLTFVEIDGIEGTKEVKTNSPYAIAGIIDMLWPLYKQDIQLLPLTPYNLSMLKNVLYREVKSLLTSYCFIEDIHSLPVSEITLVMKGKKRKILKQTSILGILDEISKAFEVETPIQVAQIGKRLYVK